MVLKIDDYVATQSKTPKSHKISSASQCRHLVFPTVLDSNYHIPEYSVNKLKDINPHRRPKSSIKNGQIC